MVAATTQALHFEQHRPLAAIGLNPLSVHCLLQTPRLSCTTAAASCDCNNTAQLHYSASCQLSLLSLLHYRTALRHNSCLCLCSSVPNNIATSRLVSNTLPHSQLHSFLHGSAGAAAFSPQSIKIRLLLRTFSTVMSPRNDVPSDSCPHGIKCPLGIESYTESCLLGLYAKRNLSRRNDVSSE